MDPLVILQVVSWNSEKYLDSCLDSLKAQVAPGYNLKIVLIDNASTDSSLEIARRKLDFHHIISLIKNTGFTGAHNLGISEALKQNAEFVCLINPDLVLEPNAILELIKATQIGPRIGASTPLLLRKKTSSDPICDASGMMFYDNFRHLDRGSNLTLRDEQMQPQYVFGGTGACLMLTREAIEDISYPKELDQNWESLQLFDPSFFAYREDAELSMRLQLRGWRVRYEPKAVGYHVRQVVPENRSDTSKILNGLSVRNRFLIQGNTLPIFFCFISLPNWLIRNLLVIFACFIKEKTSLPYLKELWSLRASISKKRKWNLSRKNIGSLSLSSIIEGRNRSSEVALVQTEREEEALKSVHAVIVAYFSSEELKENLESIFQSLGTLEKAKISIINNAPEDNSFEEARALAKLFSIKHVNVEVDIYNSSENLGFGGAANKALLNSPFDAYLVLNSDMSLADFNITTVLSLFDKYSNLAAISPLILDKETKEIQFQYLARRFPRFRDLIFDLVKIFSKNIKQKMEIHRSYADSQALLSLIEDKNKNLLEVEQVSGACMILKSSYFNQLNGFNTSFYPAWYEDVDLCKRIANNNLVSAISNITQVYHLGGESLHSLHSGRFYSIFLANKIRYYSLHESKSPLNIVAIILIFIEFIFKRLYITFRDYKTMGVSENASLVLKDFKTFISSQQATN